MKLGKSCLLVLIILVVINGCAKTSEKELAPIEIEEELEIDKEAEIEPSLTPLEPQVSKPLPKISPVLTAKYLMAFHACDSVKANCNDPRNHEIYIAQSEDGINWDPIPGYRPYKGSVPDLIRRDNTLYVYSPGQLRRYHIDTDTWEDPIQLGVMDSAGKFELFVDPSPVLDNNGQIVLFYLVGQMGGDPARCLAGEPSCTKFFRSATEVPGSDGASFNADSGNRLEIPIASQETASDPDIFKGPSGFILYISRGPSVQVFSSADMRGTYQKASNLPDGILVDKLGGIPAGHYDSATGVYWTYVHAAQGSPPISSIRRATNLNLNMQVSEFSTVLSGSTFDGLTSSYRVESPGFAVNVP